MMLVHWASNSAQGWQAEILPQLGEQWWELPRLSHDTVDHFLLLDIFFC